MQIGILGPLTASDDSGQSLAVSGVLVRAMLAMLALEPGRPLAAERLVDGLWGDDPPARTGNALATLAKRLRAGLGDAGVIAARAPGYALLIDPGAVDATRFARLAETGRQALRSGELDTAIDTLGQALALWRGPALGDVLAAPFAAAAAARLAGQRLAALEDRAQAQLAAAEQFRAALTALGSLEHRHMRIMLLVNFAVAAEAAGDLERAMLILAGCQSVFGGGFANPDAARARERARAALGEAAFEAVWARGAALNQDELLAAI
jgi:DNA-binding SARP family transcriptional activator